MFDIETGAFRQFVTGGLLSQTKSKRWWKANVIKRLADHWSKTSGVFASLTASRFDKIRKDFPALNQKVHGKKLIYFDNAATTLKPKTVIDATTNHYSKETANIHRGIHFLSEQATKKYEEARNTVI